MNMMANALRGGQVSSTPLGSVQMPTTAPNAGQPGSLLAAALQGAAKYNDASKGGLNRMVGQPAQQPAGGADGFGQLGGQVGPMGSSGLQGGSPSVGPAMALPVQQNAGAIGQVAGGALDKVGFGLGDQARGAGNFVQGNFGDAWGNVKDSVKNLFKVF